jgi:hypothetical protein
MPASNAAFHTISGNALEVECVNPQVLRGPDRDVVKRVMTVRVWRYLDLLPCCTRCLFSGGGNVPSVTDLGALAAWGRKQTYLDARTAAQTIVAKRISVIVTET